MHSACTGLSPLQMHFSPGTLGGAGHTGATASLWLLLSSAFICFLAFQWSCRGGSQGPWSPWILSIVGLCVQAKRL